MDRDIIIVIVNTIRLLLFMILAIAFNKFWIMLIAPLFMITKTKED